ncbi:outer membrane beta-barrel protein [uncultured Roseivirga sp.]|uniref:outer membrane beta-barrel protein n=1 Tax=uncultured Roseivirga sp. TaxID=543088 RepID=UPI0030D7B792
MQLRKLKKIIFRGWVVIALLIGSFSLCYGQDIYDVSYKVGPVFKIVSPKIRIDSDYVRISEEGNEIGYQFGLFTKIRVNNVYFQPELLIATAQNRLDFLNYNGVNGFNPSADFEFTTLEIPVSIGVNIGNLRLDTGPGFSLMLSGNEYFLNEKINVTQEYNQVTILWRLGLGVDINNLLLDFKYEFGLSKTEESLARLIERELVPRQSQLVFSIAYSILRD